MLPGTQPNELAIPPEPTSSCNCHIANTLGENSPRSYLPTAMALSARDPLFRTAFEIARADRPNVSELCLRCHAPLGWLNDRSKGDLAELEPEDHFSVACDLCHRMVPPANQLIGDGQYTVSPQTAKRSGRGLFTDRHLTAQSDYVGSSEMCGVCHSLFNPLEKSHDPEGTEIAPVYYEQRTYEEWRDSIFGAGATKKECVDCHMRRGTSELVGGGTVYPDAAQHVFIGSNDFVARAMRILQPELDLGPGVAFVSRIAQENLRAAVELEIRSAGPIEAFGGRNFEVSVRLTNKTGHKLPTGYPEGRRVYLEVTLELAGQTPQVLTGAWDPQTGKLVEDPQLRTYETLHGRVDAQNPRGVRTRHLIMMNQILADTRIPPEGFRPRFPDMVPHGRDYGSAPYRNYDDVTFTFAAPMVAGATSGTIKVRAMHMITDGHVVEFLTQTAPQGSPEAANLLRVYEALGKVPPKEMASVSVAMLVSPPPPEPDAGFPDTGTRDAGVMVKVDEGGCTNLGGSLQLWLMGLAGFAFWLRKK